MQKVFISYSHKDENWVKNWLLPNLESQDINTHIDYRDFEIGIASVVNMERAVEKCAKTLLVLTQHWIDSEFTQFEGIMVQTEDPIGLHKRILPLKLDGCQLPRRLKILTYADFRDENNWDFQFDRLCKQIKEDFAKIEPPKVTWPPIAEENIDISRLPKTGYELFGRQKELKILNGTWESEDTNVLSFVAYGGVGKSTLVNKWLEKMRWDNYRGAEKVFGWSFYSQGTSERVTSADKFISEALEWFGDEDPTKGSPWSKGERLAELVRRDKTLLILDGLEPLQSGHDFEKGKIKDPALSMLVTQLARNNSGLCVITTREKVAELEHFDKGVMQLNLDQISKEAGCALLRVGGVQGTDVELEDASEQFGNHALAINLLSSYLHGIEGHQISNSKDIPDLDIPEEKGRHPRRVIAAFEERFGEGAQIQLLNILGLFDRPAELDAVEAVHSPPPIEGLTDQLKDLDEGQWNKLLEELREYKLLARKSEHNPNVLDCHPLVREHFGEKLQKSNPKGWEQAHERLYEYYRALPEKLYSKFLPDTLKEMEPLYEAISHGCSAQRHQETYRDVYQNRIIRNKEYYSTKKLGAFGADLMTLSNFFDKPWSKPISALTNDEQATILNLAGYRLRALGYLIDALEPLEASLIRRIEMEDWTEAARDAGNLSEQYLALGDVKKSLDFSRNSVKYADYSKNWLQKRYQYSNLANSLHCMGEIYEAECLFIKADKLEKENKPGYPLLYGFEGFMFCELLISKGNSKEVKKRGFFSLENWSKPQRDLFDIALDNLSLGRAYLLEIIAETRERDEILMKTAYFLNQAIDGLRVSGQQWLLPPGLFARTELRKCQRSWDKAWADLEEAREIAERGQMNLYLADYHLEAARLCLAEGKSPDEVRTHYEEAAERVNKMGYHRRDPELLLIKAELEIVEGNKEQAEKTLDEAKKKIDEMGCHRWDMEVERIKNRV